MGSYTKDLSIVNEDLSSVFILDNSPGAYRHNPGNSSKHNKYVQVLAHIKQKTNSVLPVVKNAIANRYINKLLYFKVESFSSGELGLAVGVNVF